MRRAAVVGAMLSTLNLAVFTTLSPPCDADITNPYGCTHLNRDPADQTQFPRTVWQQAFAAFAIIVQIVAAAGIVLYNIRRIRWIMPKAAITPFSEVSDRMAEVKRYSRLMSV